MKNRPLFIMCIIVLLFIAACTTTGPGARSSEAFVSNNLASFFAAKLDNGIPVIIKQSPANRICSLRIGLAGHVLFTPIEKAGIETVVLRMLTRGSAAYDYEHILRLSYEKSSSFSEFSNSFDFTSFNLLTLDKYFDELYTVFIDCFLDPSWDEGEYKKIIADMQIERQKTINDPYSRMTDRLHEHFFGQHPYAANFGGTEQSLASLTINDVKKYYEDYFSPERMIVVAVGNFNPRELYTKLNTSLGRLHRKNIMLPALPAFQKITETELILEPFAPSAGVAFVRADTPIPPPTDPDYAPLLIASSMLDDLLYQNIRIENGAAYGMWSHPFAFKENYLSIAVYKTTVPEKVKKYIDESIAVLLRGRCLGARIAVSASQVEEGYNNRDAGGEVEYVPVSSALEFYKARYINQYYQGQETNASIGAEILGSVVSSGDYREYLSLIGRIRAVSAADVMRVAKNYFYEQPRMWIVLGSQQVLDRINPRDYRQFLGTTN